MDEERISSLELSPYKKKNKKKALFLIYLLKCSGADAGVQFVPGLRSLDTKTAQDKQLITLTRIDPYASVHMLQWSSPWRTDFHIHSSSIKFC